MTVLACEEGRGTVSLLSSGVRSSDSWLGLCWHRRSLERSTLLLRGVGGSPDFPCDHHTVRSLLTSPKWLWTAYWQTGMKVLSLNLAFYFDILPWWGHWSTLLQNGKVRSLAPHLAFVGMGGDRAAVFFCGFWLEESGYCLKIFCLVRFPLSCSVG